MYHRQTKYRETNINRKIECKHAAARQNSRRIRRGVSGIIRQEPLEFTITSKYVKQLFADQGGLCYYTGIPMTAEKGKYCVSIDRLDSTKGYTPENVVLSTWMANRMKGDLTMDEFLEACSKITERNRDG